MFDRRMLVFPMLWASVCLLVNGDTDRSPPEAHPRPSTRPADAGVQRVAMEETLILDEDFQRFNLDLWKHEITMGGGGNWEFQVYGNNRSNSFVEDGKLFLQPTLTSDYLGENQVSGAIPTTLDIWGLAPADQCTSNMFYGCSRSSNAGQRIPINPVMSARVRTAGTFSFRYGRLEVKAKLPKGDWLWPAIWLLPEHNAYGLWPASGEIDVMESRGNSPAYGTKTSDLGGIDASSSAIHWGPHYLMDSWDMTYGTTRLDEGATFNDDFHIFGMYWDETQLYTYVDTDDNRLLSLDFGVGTGETGLWEKGRFSERYPGVQNPWKGGTASAPYDQRFYLVMNVAVGGVSGFFPDGMGGKMWSDHDSDSAMKFFEAKPQWFATWDGKESALQVEYVKVWQTNKDYFLAPAAAAAGAGAGSGPNPFTKNANESLSKDGSEETADSGDRGELPPSGSGSTSKQAMLYATFALVGAMAGGVAVGLVLQRQNNRKWSEVYERVGATSGRSTAFGSSG